METNNKHKTKKSPISLVFLIILVLLSINSFSKPDGKQGEKINVELQTAYFDQIVIKSGFIVNLVQNTELPSSISIEATERQLKFLNFVVKDSVLEISSTRKIEKNEEVLITISFDILKSLTTHGIVEINTIKNLHINNLSLNLSQETNASLFISSLDFLCQAKGKGSLSIEGDITNFRLNLSGDLIVSNKLFSYIIYVYIKDNSEAHFEGTTDYLQIKAIDESYLNSTKMPTRECLLTVSDYGDINVLVSEKLDITGTKDGAITYKGNPVITNYYISESVIVKGGAKNKNLKEDYARIK